MPTVPVLVSRTLKIESEDNMRNKLLRLAELIQEDCPENIIDTFKAHKNPPLNDRLVLLGAARTYHQIRAANLWIDAGKKRSEEEKHATARAELASFIIAYLTGDSKEHVESAVEAMLALGRQGEDDLVKILARS